MDYSLRSRHGRHFTLKQRAPWPVGAAEVFDWPPGGGHGKRTRRSGIRDYENSKSDAICIKLRLAQSRCQFERNTMIAEIIGVATRKGTLLALIHALAWLVFSAALLAVRPALAQDAPKKPIATFTAPLPPPRPAEVRKSIESPRAPEIPTAPTDTSEPQPNPPPQSPPRILPPAPRARMHACGLEWQKMKETGAAADKLWFDFARICLTK